MTKFASIWGDLSVREDNITPAKEVTKDEEIAQSKEEDAIEEEESQTVSDVTETDIEDNTKEEDSKEDAPDNVSTEDETSEEEDEVEEYSYTEEDISKAYGMLEEEGILELTEDDEFENTSKGLADAVAATVRNKLNKEIQSIPSVVQEFYAHVAKGGDPKEFISSDVEVEWDNVDMQEEKNQTAALKTLYLQQGMTEEEAVEEIEDIPEDKLEKKAGLAAGVLAKNQKANSKAREASKLKAEKDAEKSRNTEVKELETTIDNLDELAGFKLDKARKSEFKKYLFKVKPRTGKSQMQENMNDPDRRMKIAFLDFVNYTKADLEKEVASKLTKTRKKKLTKYTDTRVKNSNNSASVKTKVKKGGQVKFPSIFGAQTIEVED